MEGIELRLGNLVYEMGVDYYGNDDAPFIDEDDKMIVRVDLNVLIQILNNNGTTDFSCYYPVPLTPEIFEKCGFQCVEGFYRKYINEQTALELEDDGHFNVFLRQIDNPSDPQHTEHLLLLPVELNSLHQLQNLYFALTGEELSINYIN
jgi:hypothetical protein